MQSLGEFKGKLGKLQLPLKVIRYNKHRLAQDVAEMQITGCWQSIRKRCQYGLVLTLLLLRKLFTVIDGVRILKDMDL